MILINKGKLSCQKNYKHRKDAKKLMNFEYLCVFLQFSILLFDSKLICDRKTCLFLISYSVNLQLWSWHNHFSSTETLSIQFHLHLNLVADRLAYYCLNDHRTGLDKRQIRCYCRPSLWAVSHPCMFCKRS